jgi:hypothetical protein
MEQTMRLQPILILCGAIAAADVLAADWQPLAADRSEMAQLDVSSVRMDGDEVHVKVLRDYAEVQFSPFDGRWVAYRSKIVTYVVDCADHKVAHLRWSLHARSKGVGRLVMAGEAGAVLRTRRPRELGDAALIERVCLRLAQLQPGNTAARPTIH